ncbi:hypothetical protein MLD38_016267 [Melastoma candidum]|uniref:Uncharacterized protein n=1 Tax=Melastoma candidum TaxID=119954 RepID=A0ACB9RIL6_9MYRT|nr:hypothetical protein MLD38_016267 [Melastoma candidum]
MSERPGEGEERTQQLTNKATKPSSSSSSSSSPHYSTEAVDERFSHSAAVLLRPFLIRYTPVRMYRLLLG